MKDIKTLIKTLVTGWLVGIILANGIFLISAAGDDTSANYYFTNLSHNYYNHNQIFTFTTGGAKGIATIMNDDVAVIKAGYVGVLPRVYYFNSSNQSVLASSATWSYNLMDLTGGMAGSTTVTTTNKVFYAQSNTRVYNGYSSSGMLYKDFVTNKTKNISDY